MAPNQTLTAAFEYDGERGRADEPSLDGGAAAARAQQHGHDGAIRSERRSRVGGRRHSLREQRKLRLLRRAAHRGVVDDSRGHCRRCRLWRDAPARRASGAASRNRCSFSHTARRPVFSAIPISRPNARADSTVGIEQRFAADRVALEAIYFANHFDDLISLGPFDPGHVQRAVRKHRGDARVRSRAAGHGVRRRRTAVQRRLYVPRFESHSQHRAAARSSRRDSPLYRQPASLGIDCRRRFSRSRVGAGAGRRFCRVAGRHRLQLPFDHVELRDTHSGTPAARFDSRGARLRSSRSTTSQTANTWSRSATRRLAAPSGQGYERGSDGPTDSRHFVERRQGLVRGIPPRTSRFRLRRGDHDVQRRRHAQPFARPAPGRSSPRRSTGSACRSITERCSWETYDAAFDRSARECSRHGHYPCRLR